jgi:hypothetical protein
METFADRRQFLGVMSPRPRPYRVLIPSHAKGRHRHHEADLPHDEVDDGNAGLPIREVTLLSKVGERP